MNIQELRTLLAIVETGSLVRASQVLNVTQSTVTARLKTLEDAVGQTLVNRNKSGATLTAAGVRLHRYADTICNLWQQARQETSLPDGMAGVCNLACEYDLWPNLGDRFYSVLHARYPQVAMSVWLGSQSEVSTWLNDGKSDLAITHRSAVKLWQGQIALRADALTLVSTNPDSPLRFDPTYVYVEGGEAFGRDHAAAYADASTSRISFGNATTGLAHILANGGSAYLPQRLTEGAVASGALFQLPDAPLFQRPIYANYNKDAQTRWPWFDDVLHRTGFTRHPPE